LDEEAQPRKCQRKSPEPEEISATGDSSEEEPENIVISKKSNADHEELEAAIGEDDNSAAETVRENVPFWNTQLVLQFYSNTFGT
jgi:hypothetical protein